MNKDGFYIDLKGDTVFGKFIDYPEYERSPDNVLFTPSASSQRISLTPKQCIKFSVAHSDTYISYQGKRLANATNYKDEQGKRPDKYEDVLIFIRELFNNGHCQLYELKDKKRSNFYVRTDTMRLTELYYKEYTDDGEAIESHVFRDQLYVLFRNTEQEGLDLQKKLQRVGYDQKSLIKFFMVMTPGKTVKIKEKYPAQFFAGIGASVNMFAIKVSKYAPTYQTSFYKSFAGTYKTQLSPVLEVGIKLFHQRNYGRLFYMLRLGAYQFENSRYSADSNNISNTFKASVISLPFSVGYKFINRADVSVALSAGASGLYLMNNVHKVTQGAGAPTFEPEYFLKLNYNFFGEAEVIWKRKTSLFTGYYFPCLLETYVYYLPHHSSVKFGLRYHF